MMKLGGTLQEWGDVVDKANCSDHPQTTQVDTNEIEKVLFYDKEEGPYAEGNSCCMVLLKDGRVAVASEWSDTSGHGCQCDGLVALYKNEEEAVALGLDTGLRDDYKKLCGKE